MEGEEKGRKRREVINETRRRKVKQADRQQKVRGYIKIAFEGNKH